MPMVFVHGVANRKSPAWLEAVRARDALFRRYLLASHRPDGGGPVEIFNPYWGDFGGKLHWGGASLPLEDFAALEAGDAGFAVLYTAVNPDRCPESPAAVVLPVARESLPQAVDLLCAAAVRTGAAPAEGIAELAVRARAYAVAEPHPAWLAEIHDDRRLVDRLRREVEAAAPAMRPAEKRLLDGAWTAVGTGMVRLQAGVVDLIGREVADRIRIAAAAPVTAFLGDVFVYLAQRNSVARAIAQRVEADLRAAARRRGRADPLVVVAHSLGGVIAYDLLTSTARDVGVDLFVTVGSQVGFFEELKLFHSSDPAVPGGDPRRRLPRPPNIRRWLNVFDHSDLLGFEAGSIIEGVEDYVYRTGLLFTAHIGYFIQPGFHERLAARARRPA